MKKRRSKNEKEILSIIKEIHTIESEVMKINNSESALVFFLIDNQKYISANRIKIPMRNQVGEKIKVKYEGDSPNKVIQNSYLLFKNGIR